MTRRNATNEAPLTPVVFHILLAMADGAQHGYAIMRHVEEASGIAMGPGTIYGSIQRMEESGLVRESDEAGEGRRKLYEMTSEGRAALRAEARRISRVADLARVRGLVAEAEQAR
jgi:DNA-binding PadR family transcriptional regulator